MSLLDRISSKEIFGMAGSATGDEAIAVLKANREGKASTTAFIAAKKDDAAAKKPQDTSSRFIVGAVFVDNIKKNGPTYLRSLRVDDYLIIWVKCYRLKRDNAIMIS